MNYTNKYLYNKAIKIETERAMSFRLVYTSGNKAVHMSK